jgi:O-antigen/teichoic acid export membrane protein
LRALSSWLWFKAAAQRMPKEPVNELGAFIALMEVLGQMQILITGVLMVFVQQTARADNEQLRRRLVGEARTIIGLAVGLWLLLVIFAFFPDGGLATRLHLPNATAMWLTLWAGLIALISPVFTGILQGEQKFGCVAISNFLNGFGRFIGVLVAVVWLQRGAAGAMAGVLAGNALAVVLLIWQTKWIWSAPTAPFAWKEWLWRAFKLTFGLATPIYMFTQDMIIVQEFFPPDEASAYGAARVIGRMLFFLTAPLTAAMFPNIVQSAARSQKSNVLIQAVGVTALIGGAAALGCSLFPALPLRILSGSRYVASAWLVPWFAWCMLPLAVANILVNNLIARERFSAVPWLVALAIAYGVALRYVDKDFISVIKTLGTFGLLLVGVCLVFTILPAKSRIKTQ